jgi:hypothetical protein
MADRLIFSASSQMAPPLLWLRSVLIWAGVGGYPAKRSKTWSRRVTLATIAFRWLTGIACDACERACDAAS